MAPAATADLTSSLPSTPASIATYKAYDHIHWYVGNAKQAAAFYVARLGFERVAFRGLETGSRLLASHVVRNGDVVFVLTSPLRGVDAKGLTEDERAVLRDVHAHLEAHGDAVKGQSLTLVNPSDSRLTQRVKTSRLQSTMHVHCTPQRSLPAPSASNRPQQPPPKRAL